MLSIAEFASRSGVSRQAIYGAIRRGKLNAIDGKIDETDPVSAEYMSQKNPSVPRQVAFINQSASEKDINVGIPRAAIDAEKAKQQAIHWRLRNEEKRGSLIDRKLVEKLIEITDAEHHRWISDGSKTIAKLAMSLSHTDASLEEITDAIRKEQSNALKSWKDKVARGLKLFYVE
jgi:uncharacterized phage infection (PIP) family protein YhgE